MPAAPPQKIGRYRIVSRLGKGAMGVVYNAHDDMMGRPVAIKVMMADFEEDPEASARFYREARAAGQLVHRNIITIFDMGEDEATGRPYIVMELLEGRTLNEYVKRPEASDIERNVDLMIQVCEGLQVAHLHGIYHRDVKPGNLVISEDGGLKILDFGIARLSSSNLTASGLIVGTPDYMSPEQARGQDVDQRSDIFSAGAVFYFMITGKKPFAASDLPGVLRKVEAEDPLPIRETEAPPALTRVIMKALAKAPTDRYQQASELITDLRRVKRELELRAKQLLEEATRRLAAVEAALVERQDIGARLDVTPQEGADGIRDRIRTTHPLLELWPDRPPQLESLGLTAVTGILTEIAAAEEIVSRDLTSMRQAESELHVAVGAAEAGDWRTALAHFDAAAVALPTCARARDGASRCRQALHDQQVADDRVASLHQQARQAAEVHEWQTVITLCDEALLVKSSATEVAALRARAVRARDDDIQQRQLQVTLALERADGFRRAGRFTDADSELARARQADPDSPQVAAFEEALQQSKLMAERASERDRRGGQAIIAARATFASGQRAAALESLRAFLAQEPDAAGVGVEIDRLEAEAKRQELIERRLAEARRDAEAADAALEIGNLDEALSLSSRALNADPAQTLAQRVSGLATARLDEQARAKARAAEAARYVLEARDLLARSKYQKARVSADKAAQLDPASEEASALRVHIDDEEARALAEKERARLAQQRAQAAAPVLAKSRAAEAEGDFARALWIAENALALDPECAEAREILQRAQARLEAQPAPTDETVDESISGKGDSDETVSLDVHASPMQRLAGLIRKWIPFGPLPWPVNRQSGPRPRQ